MGLISRSRPSPAMIVAVLALVLALAGTAIAAPDIASKAVNKAKVRQIAKKQAKKQIRKKAPGLSVAHADTADTATSADNGSAGYAEFNRFGSVRPGAFNMDNLTISFVAPYIYCEDQDFNAVVATGGITPTGQAGQASAISVEQLAELGTGPAGVGCPANTQWVYATTDQAGNFVPSNFQAVGH